MLWSDANFEDSDETTTSVPRPLEDTRVTTIMLCRHGESVGNLARTFQGTMDLPLSPIGHLQAQYTGMFLKYFGLTALWTSPQLRALRTAEEISTCIGIPWKDDARLSERYLGQLQGRLHDDVKKLWPKTWDAWKGYQPLPEEMGAEPQETVVKRLESVIFELRRMYPGQTVGVVLHGANSRCLLKRSIGNGSITTLQVGPGSRWQTQQVGYASHLPPELAKDASKANKINASKL